VDKLEIQQAKLAKEYQAELHDLIALKQELQARAALGKVLVYLILSIA
jgi:hypothetical protein